MAVEMGHAKHRRQNHSPLWNTFCLKLPSFKHVLWVLSTVLDDRGMVDEWAVFCIQEAYRVGETWAWAHIWYCKCPVEIWNMCKVLLVASREATWDHIRLPEKAIENGKVRRWCHLNNYPVLRAPHVLFMWFYFQVHWHIIYIQPNIPFWGVLFYEFDEHIQLCNSHHNQDIK